MAILKGLQRRLALIAIAGAVAVTLIIIFNTNDKNVQPEIITGNSLLKKIMNSSGGKENYEGIKSLSFEKAFKLYDKDSTTEIDRLEKHTYDFTNGAVRSITWKDSLHTYKLIQRDTAILQFKDGTLDTSVSRKALQNKLYAATFVLGLPYTLDTDSSAKTYLGITDFQGKPAHELKVTFQDGTDTWYLYYDESTLDWLGYWVQTSDHYSLVINEEMINEKGFTLSRKRKSYRTDAQKNRLYLRADYEYSNYLIQ